MRILINNRTNLFSIPQLPTPSLRRMNAFELPRPSLVSGNDGYCLPDVYVFAISSFTFSITCWGYFGNSSKINLVRVANLVVSSDMFPAPAICDKANQGFVSTSSLLLDRKPFNLRPFVIEIIECTWSTTPELSFLSLVSTSITSLPNVSSSNILFKKRYVSEPWGKHVFHHA